MINNLYYIILADSQNFLNNESEIKIIIFEINISEKKSDISIYNEFQKESIILSDNNYGIKSIISNNDIFPI